MNSMIVPFVLFMIGLGLVVYAAEKLVEGAVGTAIGFGLSPFLVSVVFLGFDPENLAVGGAGSYEAAAGIALGSIIGAAMVAIALAFGVTALLAPMDFEQVSKRVLATPGAAVLFWGILAWDGELSRLDGGLLFLGFVLAIGFLWWLNQRGLDIEASGEVAETLEQAEELSKWKSAGLLLLSLAGVIIGSEILVTGAQQIIDNFGISETVFGMTILALLVSIEELARELPAARRGESEISFGNVAGSILAFFLFNAGIIALISPIPVGDDVLKFYLPVCFITVIIISFLMTTKRIGRWAGGLLVLLYLIFAAGGYLVTGGAFSRLMG